MEEILPIVLPILTTAYTTISYTLSTLLSITTPALKSLFSAHPDLASLALLLVILYFSLLILQQASRWIYATAMMMIRLVFIVGFILAIINISRRGWKQTADDLWGVWKSVETVVLFVAEMVGREVEKVGKAEGGKYTYGAGSGGGPAGQRKYGKPAGGGYNAGRAGGYKGPKTRTIRRGY